MQESKKIQAENRARKTRVSQRIKQYCLFLDASNAFDHVRKEKLAEIMTAAGYNKTLIEAIKSLLTDTEILVQGKVIRTKRGTP